MHVLFAHRAFPARLGHLAQRLVDQHGCRVTFISSRGGRSTGGMRRLAYKPVGVEGDLNVPPISEPFVDANRHAVGVLQALRRAEATDESVRPDLIIGPGGLGVTHLLPELWPGVPIVNLFDWFYTPAAPSDRRDDDTLPDRLHARGRIAATLLDLEAMAAGWTPTQHQRSLFGRRHGRRLVTIPEGVDTSMWHRVEVEERRLGKLDLSGRKLVTFVAREGEPGRGRAAFLPIARRLVEARPDVEVLMVVPQTPGAAATVSPLSPSSGGGAMPPSMRSRLERQKAAKANGDEEAAPPKISAPSPRIRVNKPLPPAQLRRILSMSDLHVHVGAPHALPWSLLDAMACGAPILATATKPIREVLTDGETAALARPDTDAVATRALDLLEDGDSARRLGEAGREFVQARHSLDVVMPDLFSLWAGVMGEDPDVFRVD